ncbi:hypothetical protein ACIBEJ_34330 [Nonomuraea sp. NPDC050790]|uniref:hypothetical protein n=1 Tax=Nonomuraea sp. NPDC050790 TaxID=3364371 RepID=UPI0037A02F18
MGFAEQVALAKDTAFRDRVRMAAITAAVNVAGEAQSTLSSAAYHKRQVLATRVLTNAGSGAQGDVLDMFAWAVAQNAAITGASTDSDIQFTVNAIWSDCAGVHALD